MLANHILRRFVSRRSLTTGTRWRRASITSASGQAKDSSNVIVISCDGPIQQGFFTSVQGGFVKPVYSTDPTIYAAQVRHMGIYPLTPEGSRHERLRHLTEKATKKRSQSIYSFLLGFAAGGLARMVVNVQREPSILEPEVLSDTFKSPSKRSSSWLLNGRGVGSALHREYRRVTAFAPHYHHSPGGLIAQATFCTSASPLQTQLSSGDSKILQNSVKFLDIDDSKVFNLKKVMEILRDLELLDTLWNKKRKTGNTYKDARVYLYPLWHEAETNGKVNATFGQLRQVLPPICSVAWTAIAEYITTGTVWSLSSLDSEEKAMVSFLQIFNVGPAAAHQFVEQGARTFAGLERKCHLSKSQKIGLKHREDINRLIPMSEMNLIKEALVKVVSEADPRFEMEIMGSYRRGVPFSSDIDLVIRHHLNTEDAPKETSAVLLLKVIEALTTQGLVSEDTKLALGAKKYMGLIKLPDHQQYRRIDIRMAPYNSYPYMQLSSTGDVLLMKLMRHVAKSKGMCLNDYGMGEKYSTSERNPNGFKPGTFHKVDNEEAIFKVLGLPYLSPQERDFASWKNKYLEAGINLSPI